MDKGPDAFRTISEVADDLDLPQHVLRFWETRFTQIKPMKRGGGRRYYRPDDVDLLRGIRHLLYGEGYTIKGVQRILRDSGVRHVMQIWHEDYQPEQTAAPAQMTAPPETASKEANGAHLANDAGPVPKDIETGQPAPSPAAIGENAQQAAQPVRPALGTDDVKYLKTTLFELLECKRLLDQVR